MPARCSLFESFSDEKLQEALKILKARETVYPKATVLKNALQPLSSFGLVLEGAVQVTMTDLDGEEMLLAYVPPGNTFGESLCFLRRNAPIIITAQSGTRLMWLDCKALREPPAGPLQQELQGRFTAMLARRTLNMNDRIQILSRKSIREKLNAYFTVCVRDAGSMTFAVPFDRAGMAAYLGTDRSALCRELSRMQQEGLLKFDKNHFTLHPQQTMIPAPDMMDPASQPERRNR